MDLMRIEDEGAFMGVVYPGGLHRSLRSSLIKNVNYNDSEDAILMEWTDANTLEFIYTKVEDPDSPGEPLSSLDDLWSLIFSIIGTSIDISNFTFNDGNNFIFLDGNNFTFNS